MRIIACVLSMTLALSMLAGAASAECAWVLWTETEQKPLKAGAIERVDSAWKFHHYVHDTRAECEAALSREMDSVTQTFTRIGAQMFQPPGDAPDFFVRTWPRRLGIQKQGEWLLFYSYACLPATFDPRGSKR